MRTTKVLAGAVSLVILMASALQVAASDNLPIFGYRGTYKVYDNSQDKVVSRTSYAYVVVDEMTDVATVVWYGGTGADRWYWTERDVPLHLKTSSSSGIVMLAFKGTHVGYGKIKFSATSGAISSCSVTGTLVNFEPGETGTFSFTFNSAMTSKANRNGMNALDQVIADLLLKHYREVY